MKTLSQLTFILFVTLNLAWSSHATASIMATNELNIIEFDTGRTTDRYGNANGAITFDGQSSYVRLEADTDAESFSFALNFKVGDNNEPGSAVFDLGAFPFFDNDGQLLLALNDPAWFGLSHLSVTPSFIDITTDIFVPTSSVSVWHHFAVTFDHNTGILQAFLDEELLWNFSTLFDGPSEWDIIQSWELGRYRNDFFSPYFQGAMSNIFFDDRVISEDELSLLAAGVNLSTLGVSEPTGLFAAGLTLLLLGRRRRS